MRVWTVAAAFEAITRSWTGGVALLGVGRWSDRDHERLGFLDLARARPRTVWDGFVARDDHAKLRAQLAGRGRIDAGQLDFMYATRWKVAWTDSPDRIAIYSRRGLRGVVTAEHVDLVPRSGDRRRIARDDVAEIESEGGAFRARTRVRVRPKQERAVTIVSAYDFDNWMSDDPWEIYESWPHELAAAIKRRLRLAAAR